VSETRIHPTDTPAASGATQARLLDRHRLAAAGDLAAAVTLVPSLDELAADPARAAGLPRETAMALLARCAVAQSALVGCLLRAPSMATAMPDGQQEDQLLDVDEAADRLGTSTDYLYRHSGKLPFTVRIGSRLRFSARGIDRFIRTRQGR
jgi:excisionase family DNA binding protein